MAIGTISIDARSQVSSESMSMDLIHFAGDSAYTTGGTAAFEAAFQAALKAGHRQILGVMGQDCGGYTVAYDFTNKTLKVYRANYPAVAAGALQEVPATTDLSGVTFNMLVYSI